MSKIIVPLSGGKDSQACLKLAVERVGAKNVEGVFCDTGFEHPATYRHVDYIADYYDIKIYKLKRSSMEELILTNKRFPNRFMRFCTSRLKIRPMRDFLKTKENAIVYYGMRADESKHRTEKYGSLDENQLIKPHDLNVEYPKSLHDKNNIYFQLPIVGWTTEQVFDYLSIDAVNPLYKKGFERVGCFPCLISKPVRQENCFNFDKFGRQQKEKIISIESQINKKFEPVDTSQMCMFCTI